MIDSFGRDINYLRISVTKRCNLKCRYCTDSGCGCDEELTAMHIETIAEAFAHFGIKKIRLTGGEPLVRKDISEIAKRLCAVPGIEKVAVTTNGVLLEKYADDLKKAGITGVNISLDTTDAEQYARITGADCIEKVFAGIEKAQQVGLSPVRINAVLIRGENDEQALPLINLAKKSKIDVRFIELMPFSESAQGKKVITGDELLERFPFLIPCESKKTKGFEQSVARYYTADGFLGRIGLITPVSNNFCSECNRIRLLSNGKVRPCLGNNSEIDLMDVIDNKELLYQRVKQAILSKPQTHLFDCGYGNFHGMNNIGG